jgi:hypothetical protein
MLSVASVLRWSLVVGVVGMRFVAGCAFAPTDSEQSSDGGCSSGDCSEGDSGGSTQSEDAYSGGGGNENEKDGGTSDARGSAPVDAGPQPIEDSGSVVVNEDSGGWVNMTDASAACDDLPGAPCGWSATNNGLGNTCACRHGTWADGWTCEAPNAPVTAGASCPGVVGTVDAALPPLADAGGSDTGTTGSADAGGWVDMSPSATACDNHPGTPCGWNATNNGSGYTCACRHGDWADGWTCEIANAPVTAGPACPDAGP